MFPMFIQVGEAIKEHGDAITATSVMSALITGFKLWDHEKGKKRDRKSTAILMDMREDLQKVAWFVSGPNGDAGLVQDMADLKKDFINLRIEVSRHLPPDDVPPNWRRRE